VTATDKRKATAVAGLVGAAGILLGIYALYKLRVIKKEHFFRAKDSLAQKLGMLPEDLV